MKVPAKNLKTKDQSLAMQQITVCELTAADGKTSHVLADGRHGNAVYYRGAIQFMSRETAARKKAAAEGVERVKQLVPRIPVNFVSRQDGKPLEVVKLFALGWRPM